MTDILPELDAGEKGIVFVGEKTGENRCQNCFPKAFFLLLGRALAGFVGRK
jgi:hypothetical protein